MKSLVGRKFGRLKVTAFAGFGTGVSRPYWCCACDCGSSCRVEGRLLLATKDEANHRQISCGCARADPKIRRAARMKVPPGQRAAICNKMRKAVTRRSKPYSMDVLRAAELLDVSEQRIGILAKDGILGFTYRRGTLWVSSQDVATLLATQERNKKRCAMELSGIAKASAKRMPWPAEYFDVNPLARHPAQSTAIPHRRGQPPEESGDEFG